MLSVEKSFKKYEEESDFMYNLYDSYSKKEIIKMNWFINRKIREFSALRKRKNNLYIHSIESYEFQDNKRITILIHNSKLIDNDKDDKNTKSTERKGNNYYLLNNTITSPASESSYINTNGITIDTSKTVATTDAVVNYVDATIKDAMRFKDPLYDYILLSKLKVDNSNIGLLEMIVAIELEDNEVSTISLKDSKFDSLYRSDVRSIKNLMRTTLREYPSVIFKKKLDSTDMNSDTVTDVPTSNEKENINFSISTPKYEENAQETPENNNEVKL